MGAIFRTTRTSMSDLHGHESMAREPSEEELRAYLMELRQADPAEFLMQAVNMLVTGAQAKIGLPDGRLLIDAIAGMLSATQDRLPAELGDALGNAVVQLQTAQVAAERELAAMAGQVAPEGEGAPAGEQPAPSAPGGPTVSEPQKKMTDRLWIPGKGAPPPVR